MQQQLKQLTINSIGFTPTFINADLGKFTGTIIIHQKWPLAPAELEKQGLPPTNNLPANIWDGISKLDDELANLLQADITHLWVSFKAASNSYEFIITFYHE